MIQRERLCRVHTKILTVKLVLLLVRKKKQKNFWIAIKNASLSTHKFCSPISQWFLKKSVVASSMFTAGYRDSQWTDCKVWWLHDMHVSQEKLNAVFFSIFLCFLVACFIVLLECFSVINKTLWHQPITKLIHLLSLSCHVKQAH